MREKRSGTWLTAIRCHISPRLETRPVLLTKVTLVTTALHKVREKELMAEELCSSERYPMGQPIELNKCLQDHRTVRRLVVCSASAEREPP